MSAPDDNAAVVQLEDVAMRFNDDDPVLDGVDLEVAQKERVVILGQSGSGKSTILRLILGILTPTRGHIFFKGRDIARMSRRQLNRARQKIGMIYQYSALISELSGGMKKRVGFARGLVLEPELLLFDEPTAGLDPVMRGEVDELIVELSKKSTCIIVTHEMESAFKVATRMAMLYEGRIIADDEPESFRDHENPVVAQFVSGSTE